VTAYFSLLLIIFPPVVGPSYPLGNPLGMKYPASRPRGPFEYITSSEADFDGFLSWRELGLDAESLVSSGW